MDYFRLARDPLAIVLTSCPDSVDLAIDLEEHGIAEWDYNSGMASAGQSIEQLRQAQDVDAFLLWRGPLAPTARLNFSTGAG